MSEERLRRTWSIWRSAARRTWATWREAPLTSEDITLSTAGWGHPLDERALPMCTCSTRSSNHQVHMDDHDPGCRWLLVRCHPCGGTGWCSHCGGEGVPSEVSCDHCMCSHAPPSCPLEPIEVHDEGSNT